MEVERIRWINVAKGICMISVVAGHLGVQTINYVVFAYHVTIFFILSGYTLKDNFSVENTQKQFIRLMVPYFITCIAVTMMDIINQILWGNTATPALTQLLGHDIMRSFAASGGINTLGSIEIGGRIGAIWYLPATFFAVISVQLLLKYVDQKVQRYIISIGLSISSYFIAKFTWLPFSILPAFFAAPLVLLGYDLKQSERLNTISLSRVFVCLCLFVAGIITKKSPVYYVSADMPDLILSPICALAASLCIIWLSQKLQKSKILAWIGRNSIYFLCINLFEMETMGVWFNKILTLLGIPVNAFSLFTIEMLFLFSITECILTLKKFARSTCCKEHRLEKKSKRDPALDIAKSVLIILMIVGHFYIDQQLRKIIYSFHMVAFIFYSGYCFRSESAKHLSKSILRLAQNFLVPYAVFGIFYILLNHNGFLTEIKCLLGGISFANKLFTNLQSIGPVYFILLLFLIRVIFLLIDRYIPQEPWKAATVICISLFGVYLGKVGYWLPWSLDCAMYALVFYYLGYCFKKYNVMEFLCKRYYCYFLLSCAWAFMIHNGSMELAIRNYGSYGLTILGATSATVLLYIACRYICSACSGKFLNLLCRIGKNTLYILIVHTLTSAIIGRYVSKLFEGESIYFTIFVIILQLIAGVIIGESHRGRGKWFFSRPPMALLKRISSCKFDR